jgi:hypothetical protein
MIPAPTNKIPAATDSRGAPPVPGNALTLARGLVETPDVTVAEGEALSVGVAVGVALGVGVALDVGVAVAVEVATMSSPVGLSSKLRTPPRSSPPRSSPVGLSSWANAACANTSAASATTNTNINDLRIFFLSLCLGCITIRA